jgi:hypothetical protein
MINFGLQLVPLAYELAAKRFHLLQLLSIGRLQCRLFDLLSDQYNVEDLNRIVLTSFRSCCTFNPAPYHAPVAVIAAMEPVNTTRRSFAMLGFDMMKC